MENRQGYIILGKSGGTSGKGGYTARVTIPTAWAKELELFDTENKDNRKIELFFDGEQIVIKKKLD